MTHHRPVRVVAALAAAALLGGCAVGAAQLGTRDRAEPSRRLARYTVVAKEAPNTLVADNQLRCQVDGERFAEVDVGDRVWCMWG
jgi:hypothetical protein